MKNFSLELSHLSKSFSQPVLQDLSLKVEAGQFISIMGVSGSGKSTLLNIIGLIESFDDGSYRFAGSEIKSKKDYASLRLNEIGFIFQNYNLLDRLTGLENIYFPLNYGGHKQASAISLELAKQFSVQRYWKKNVNVLSGGEKQRLAIVRALIRNPNVILADEPSGNLDAENSEIVLHALKYARDQGKAVILVTHDTDMAREADNAYFLRDGSLCRV